MRATFHLQYRHHRHHRHLRYSGFSLLELLIIIAIIVILAGLLAPALAQARGKAIQVSCQSNLRQLQVAWLLYSEDSNGMLSPAETSNSHGAAPRWVDGSMRYTSGNYLPSDATNVSLLFSSGQGRLGQYTRVPGVYHCPADRSRTNIWVQRGPLRVRSYSLNACFGGGEGITVLDQVGYAFL